MAQLPAICTNCGFSFPTGISVGNSTVTVGGGTARCRRCGGLAVIPSGTYTEAQGILSLLQKDQWGREQIIRFRDIAQAAARKEITPSQAAEQARLIAPDSLIIPFLEKNPTLVAIILALLMMLQTHLNFSASDQSSEEATNKVLAQLQAGQISAERLLQQIDQTFSALSNEPVEPPASITQPQSKTQPEIDSAEPIPKRRMRRQRGKQEEIRKRLGPPL